MADTVFEYSRPAFKFAVYPNRVEVEEGTFRKKRETIPLKTVTSVSIEGMSRKLKLVTSGKTHEYQLGTKGDEARDAIAALL